MRTKTIEGVVYVQEREREHCDCVGCVACHDNGLCMLLNECRASLQDDKVGRIWVVQKSPPRPVDEALAELLAERDALKAELARVREHSAHVAALYGRQIQEIALLRTFYARQDATSWEAVRQFDAKGPG